MTLKDRLVSLALTVVITFVLVMQIYRQSQDTDYQAVLANHVAEMNNFLDGWTRYDSVVDRAEVTLRQQA